jgi:hypothetical protein
MADEILGEKMRMADLGECEFTNSCPVEPAILIVPGTRESKNSA